MQNALGICLLSFCQLPFSDFCWACLPNKTPNNNKPPLKRDSYGSDRVNDEQVFLTMPKISMKQPIKYHFVKFDIFQLKMLDLEHEYIVLVGKPCHQRNVG
jgi:hypothetical protein